MRHWRTLVSTTMAAAAAASALLIAPSSVAAGAPAQLAVHETPAPTLVPGVTETSTVTLTNTGRTRLYGVVLTAGDCQGVLCGDVEIALAVEGQCVLGGPGCLPSPAVTLLTIAARSVPLTASIPPGGRVHLVVREDLTPDAPAGRTTTEAWAYSGSQ